MRIVLIFYRVNYRVLVVIFREFTGLGASMLY